uniref:SCAN box domain-containing protein n=1 Tax=Naja naja TaxID=35670 RepID=A0A8C6XJN8_NAJNA
MEEFERNGLALAGPTRFRKSPYVVQAFTVGEHFSRMTAKPTERDLEEGMLSPCWEAQWRDILKNTPSPYPGWSHPHIPETRAGEELLQEEAGGLLAPERPLKTSLDADPAEQGEDGEVKGEGQAQETSSAELHRQHFRWLCYQEAEGPWDVCARLRELCLNWLQPELNSKERMVELVVLEQFLAILPEDLQGWVGESGPETCVKITPPKKISFHKRQPATSVIPG